jgi:hypothetical protein
MPPIRSTAYRQYECPGKLKISRPNLTRKGQIKSDSDTASLLGHQAFAQPSLKKERRRTIYAGPAWVVHPTKEAADLFGPVARYSRSGFGGTERGDPPGQAKPTVPQALRVSSSSEPWKVS